MSATNIEIARLLDQMAAGLEILGANRFRVNAYTRASRVVNDCTDDLRSVVEEDLATAVKRLTAYSGIGKGMAEKIVEYVETGVMEEHRQLLDDVPAGVFDLLEIPGIGPKAAQAMWRELGIASVDDLEATPDDKLATIPRMGPKSVENIRKAIAFSKKSGDRVPIGLARPLAEELQAVLAEVEGVRRIDYAGSLRRGKETIGDLDFLVACDDPAAVRAAFVGLPQVTQVLAEGDTKSSVRLETERAVMQADLRIVPEAVYGA
ncbi:MAG: helix-hairpin-helix domain-containing protein, partial [Acidobacteriota bacterium]